MLQEIDFKRLARQETNARKRLRLLALAHFQDGTNRSDIARMLKVSRTSVNKWVADFLSKGLKGLNYTTSSGRPPSLSAKQLAQLKEFVVLFSQSEEGGRLTGTDINQYIKDKFGLSYEHSHVYRVLKKLNLSWITSRSRHPKQSLETQDEFKKTTN